MDTKPKLCIDCKHHSSNQFPPDLYWGEQCYRKIHLRICPVTGCKSIQGRLCCYNERKELGEDLHCGKEGKFWEPAPPRPKPTFFSRLIKKLFDA